MEKDFLYPELLRIYTTVMEDQKISKETQLEFSLLIKERDKNSENYEDFTMNYLILNLINLLESLEENSPEFNLLLEEVKIKIFSFTIKHLPFENKNLIDLYFNKFKPNKSEIFATTKNGGIIYKFYTPLRNEFNLPAYGNEGFLNVSYSIDDKTYIQKVRINSFGRVLELVDDPEEQIDYTKMNDDEFNELYNELLNEVLAIDAV